MKGRKTGGRRKGTPNKRTIMREAWTARVIASGVQPLEFLLAVMRAELRDENGVRVRVPVAERLAAARAAAPYIHKRMPQEVGVAGGGAVQINVNLGGDED